LFSNDTTDLSLSSVEGIFLPTADVFPGLGSLLYFSTSLQSKKVLGKSNEVQVKSTLLEKYLSKK